MFKVSQAVVYPGYGVAQISREIEKLIGIQKMRFYELKFMNRDVTILVPVDGVSSVGVRNISTQDKVLNIFQIFAEKIDYEYIADVMSSSWNRRSKEYQNRIRTGSLSELASIYKEIKVIGKQKALSFGEKAVFAQVEHLLSEECAFVNKSQIEQVSEELNICCEACIKGLSHTLSSFFSQRIDLYQESQVLK